MDGGEVGFGGGPLGGDGLYGSVGLGDGWARANTAVAMVSARVVAIVSRGLIMIAPRPR
jgi:hypothetical protein